MPGKIMLRVEMLIGSQDEFEIQTKSNNVLSDETILYKYYSKLTLY